MRYLVTARVKQECRQALLKAIENQTLGEGSVHHVAERGLVEDAHDRRRCRDQNGSEPWACGDCDCTSRLEQKLNTTGKSFLESLRSEVAAARRD